MIAAWEKLKVEMPTYATVIDAGLHKLIDYQERRGLISPPRIPAWTQCTSSRRPLDYSWLGHHCNMGGRLVDVHPFMLSSTRPCLLDVQWMYSVSIGHLLDIY